MADIDFGQLSEALNDKADTDLRNVDTTAKADAVIDYQEPTSANNWTWYRKYKSGWVEQGGTKNVGTGQVNFPIVMANVGYQVQVTGGDDNYGINYIARNRTTTAVWITARTSDGNDFNNWYGYWLVCGMAAS